MQFYLEIKQIGSFTTFFSFSKIFKKYWKWPNLCKSAPMKARNTMTSNHSWKRPCIIYWLPTIYLVLCYHMLCTLFYVTICYIYFALCYHMPCTNMQKNLWKHPLNSGHYHLNETTTLDYHQFGNVIMSN